MKNEKAIRRKRKLADRNLRQQKWTKKVAQRNQYPKFEFDNTHADPEFAKLIRTAVDQFNFAELSPIDQRVYRIMKQCGANEARNVLREAMEVVRSHDPHNVSAHIGDIAWMITTGEG